MDERKAGQETAETRTRGHRRWPDTVVVTVSVSESTSYLLPELPLEQEVEMLAGSNWWQLRDILGLRDIEVIWTVNGRIAKEEGPLPEPRREVLVLTGVVMGREPTAIIEGPRGDYYVKVGETIGSKKVIEIAPDRVVLLEGEKRITLKLRGE